MIYEYMCEDCKKVYVRDYPLGEAPRKIICEECKKRIPKRIMKPYLSIPNPTSEARRGRGRG